MSSEEEILLHYPDENVAIEYYTPTSVIKITRNEMCTTATNIKSFLKNMNINSSKFIAINFDIKRYCVPALIKGLIEADLAFVYRAEKAEVDVCARLNVNLIFSHNVLMGTEILYEFEMHGNSVLLLIYKHMQVTRVSSIMSTAEIFRKFCYAIATSGTTGTPSIIKVTSKCIRLNEQDFVDILKITGEDKVAQLTPLTFDPSIIELYLGIWNNCSLFMASEELQKNPQQLLEKMLASKVTILQTTPSLLLSKWSKESLKEKLLSKNTSLRILVLGGEPFPKIDILLSIRHEENNTQFFNAYGITEVSCWASLHEIVPGSIEPLKTRTDCLGKRLSKTYFSVKNNKAWDIKEGTGVLYIGSWDRLCEIYDQESILNEKLFRPLFRDTGDIVQIDSDGNIFYIGRRDCQIKRFGNKVNTNELEKCVMSHTLVAKCVVIWNENEHKLHICVCSISDLSNLQNFKNELRQCLNILPEYYQPDKIHIMNNFPLTEHGKICKRSLEKICSRRIKPLENLLETVKDLWEEYLQFSDDSGFLSLGGTSVLALQMSNAISDLLSIELPELITLFLNNATFSECLPVISNAIEVKNDCTNINNVEKITKVSDTNKRKHFNSESNNGSKCMWQKCRGIKYDPVYGSRIENLEIVTSYDLQKCVDASPTVFKYSNGETFVTVASHSGIVCTVALDNINLKECYQIQLPDRVEASVLILSDFRGVVGCHDKNVYCFHLKTGQILWKFETKNLVKCPALSCVREEQIFVGSYDAHIYCLSEHDGTEVWKTKVSEGSISAAVKYNFEKDILFVGTLNGTCAGLDRCSGKVIWQRNISDAIFSSPAILKNGNVVFCTVIGTLYCFNVEENTQVWMYLTKMKIFSYLVVHNNPLTKCDNICFTADDNFFRLECDTTEGDTAPVLRYKIKLRARTMCTPWCEGNMIALADSEGTIYILDFWKGNIVADIQLNKPIFSSPVLHNDHVVVGCRDDKLYVLKLIRKD